MYVFTTPYCCPLQATRTIGVYRSLFFNRWVQDLNLGSLWYTITATAFAETITTRPRRPHQSGQFGVIKACANGESQKYLTIDLILRNEDNEFAAEHCVSCSKYCRKHNVRTTSFGCISLYHIAIDIFYLTKLQVRIPNFLLWSTVFFIN